jgi:hypothetical protein
VNSRTVSGSRQEEHSFVCYEIDSMSGKKHVRNATGVTDKEKEDMLMKVIIPAISRPP